MNDAYRRLVDWLRTSGHASSFDGPWFIVDGQRWEAWIAGTPSVENMNASFTELKRKSRLVFDMEPDAVALKNRLDELTGRFPDVTIEPYAHGSDQAWRPLMFTQGGVDPFVWTIVVHPLDTVNYQREIHVRMSGRLSVASSSSATEMVLDTLPDLIESIRRNMRDRLARRIDELRNQMELRIDDLSDQLSAYEAAQK